MAKTVVEFSLKLTGQSQQVRNATDEIVDALRDVADHYQAQR
jgi:hypothetical protein